MEGVFRAYYRDGYTLHKPGELVDMEDEAWAGAVARGIIVPAVADSTPASMPEPEPEPAPTPKPAEAESVVEVERPRKTAPKAEWEKYAHSKGIKTAGMSVREIIAACS